MLSPTIIQVCTSKKYIYFQISSSLRVNGFREAQKAASQIYNQGQVFSEFQGKMFRRGEQLLLMTEKVVMIHSTASNLCPCALNCYENNWIGNTYLNREKLLMLNFHQYK